MRTALSVSFLASVLAPWPTAADEVTARVRSIYYQAGGAVLVEPRLLRRPDAPRWANVELSDRSRALVQLPSDLQPRIGDVVVVQIAAPKSLGAAGPLRVSRVTAIKEIEAPPPSPKR